MKHFNTLLRLNLEIDGAIRTYADRQNADSLALLNEKVAKFNEIIKEITDEGACKHSILTYATVPDNNEKETEILIKQQDKSEATPVPEKEEVTEIINSAVIPDSSAITTEPTDKIEEEPYAKNDVIEQTEQLILDEDSLVDNTVKINDEEPIYEPETVSATKSEDSGTVNITPERTEPLRVEEAISIREAKDLTKAFTLNDKFRFLRGLFCDDKADFNDTLKHLSELDSLDEAFDYLLNDLEWDVDNEEVQAFITIIANHFNEA